MLVELMPTWVEAGLFAVAVVAAGWLYRRLRNLDAPDRRPPLDCGCPCDGRPEYMCMNCRHTRCDLHRDRPHECVDPAELSVGGSRL